MNKIFLICLVIGLSGCKTVRQEDLDAWRGAPLSDLETHYLFNTLPVEVRQISGGKFLYIYTNSKTTKPLFPSTVSCRSTSSLIGGTQQTQCSKDNVFGGEPTTKTCSNQFITTTTTVLEYRPVGQCYTDCSIRPESRPCN